MNPRAPARQSGAAFGFAAILLSTVTTAPKPVEAASPQAILHKVSERGETYERLADHYYGSRYLAHHLSAANRYQEPLKPGVTLIIPTHRRVKLSNVGELEEFARRHLSRASRAAYLRRLHDLQDSDRDRSLIVPPALRHRVRPGESLKAIARTYYRDTSVRRRELLRLYNDLPSELVRPGSVLRIPLDSPTFAHARVLARSRLPLADTSPASSVDEAPLPEATEAPLAESTDVAPATAPLQSRLPKPPPASREPPPRATRKTRPSTARAEKPKPVRVRWAPRVEQVERHYADGDYAQSLETAYAHLRSGSRIPTRYRTRLLSLAASALVALARTDEAEGRFRELLALTPDYEPDAYRTSPKILDVFEAAKRATTAPGDSGNRASPDTIDE